MRSDAYITVTCDGCGDEIQIQLTTTARGYDERGVSGELEIAGWVSAGNADYCEECAAERDADDTDDERSDNVEES